ncbi:GGDEF domain-containing protein [Salimicrobium flavidum]|uniref:Diguanylate cyclase n=1 Tax=Salimicrobium flavidum TaxID=570947 RepID=A0A1N7KUQ8_9BACI|nr:diguanylate cyclase [Salimicrobium flavidum]SIS65325.1 diguanylate cyclase [Salimicrobium flavidum]
MILKELISNLAILITSLFIYSQLTNNSVLRPSSSLKVKAMAGVLAGLLSNILMQYSMHLDQTIIDLRHIPLILVTYYGGSVPGLISMIFIITGRFLIGFNASSLLAVIFIVLVALTTLWTSKINAKRTVKAFISLTSSNVIFTIVICYLLRDPSVLLPLLSYFWIISYLAGFSSFYVIEYVRENQRMLKQFKSEASTDVLTGLRNVRNFDESFNDISIQASQNNELLSLLFIDIDHFKKVNDTYGHKEGDQVLMELGDLLVNSVRSFDIVSRNGGEEFTVLLLDCPMERSKQIGEKIRENIENHSFLLTTGETIDVTVSIGVACYNETTTPPQMLLEDADQALYEAKRTGRNKVCVA